MLLRLQIESLSCKDFELQPPFVMLGGAQPFESLLLQSPVVMLGGSQIFEVTIGRLGLQPPIVMVGGPQPKETEIADGSLPSTYCSFKVR